MKDYFFRYEDIVVLWIILLCFKLFLFVRIISLCYDYLFVLWIYSYEYFLKSWFLFCIMIICLCYDYLLMFCLSSCVVIIFLCYEYLLILLSSSAMIFSIYYSTDILNLISFSPQRYDPHFLRYYHYFLMCKWTVKYSAGARPIKANLGKLRIASKVSIKTWKI